MSWVVYILIITSAAVVLSPSWKIILWRLGKLHDELL